MTTRRMMRKPPIIEVVGAAILEAGACLVTQRGAGGEEALKWEFPGGKVEPNETPRAALEREISEELGLTIEVGARLGRSEHADARRTIVLDVYAARIVAGRIRLAEHRRYGWFRAGQLDVLDWAAADRPLLPTLRELLRISDIPSPSRDLERGR